MAALLQREKVKNEAHLQPLRENAQKLSFLTEATKSNDGIPHHNYANQFFHYLRRQTF